MENLFDSCVSQEILLSYNVDALFQNIIFSGYYDYTEINHCFFKNCKFESVVFQGIDFDDTLFENTFLSNQDFSGRSF